MTVRIALDAMGGDNAPQAIVEGAVQAARLFNDIEITLIGREDAIKAELAKHPTEGLKLPIVNATEVIGMDEHPVDSIRSKKDSSMVTAFRMVKEGRADVFLSAGNTGAVVAGAQLTLGRIRGVRRSALGTVFPSERERIFVLDIGANPDPKVEDYVANAIMGSLYMERVIGVKNPKVGLLSNGTEEIKGSEPVIQAHQALRNLKSQINFYGNVEGNNVLEGVVDVVVTDGFTGNVTIKISEGVQALIIGSLRKEMTSSLINKLAAAVLRPALRRMAKRLDYTEYGGAALLGVNGLAVKAHGKSNARAVISAVRVARQMAQQQLLELIRTGIAGVSSGEPTATS